MEYYEELSYWYSNGYFYEINTKFACPLMENLVDSFEGGSAEYDNETDATADGNMTESYVPPKATFYFSHSTAILPFLSLLGLNKDDYVLTHSNYEEAKSR